MTNKYYEKIYEFKITLIGISPPIWRKIRVPETYTFWDLHVAIQDSMGWSDSHLHEFEVVNPSTAVKVAIGIPKESFDEVRNVLPGWEQKIAAYFSKNNPEAAYLYDFGDDWMHEMSLKTYSRGKLACTTRSAFPESGHVRQRTAVGFGVTRIF